MHRKIALIIGIILMTVFAMAADPPAGYEWSSPLGALRASDKNPNVKIFDTTSGNFLTDGKQTIVNYNTTKAKGLTDLGITLKGKLMKIEDISDVAVEYRRLWIQKFPLSTWDTIMPELQKALK